VGLLGQVGLAGAGGEAAKTVSGADRPAAGDENAVAGAHAAARHAVGRHGGRLDGAALLV
jgi:hypothetical protein